MDKRMKEAKELIEKVTKKQQKLKNDIASLRAEKYKIINDIVFKDKIEKFKDIDKTFGKFARIANSEESITQLNTNLKDIFQRCFKTWVSKRFITDINLQGIVKKSYGYNEDKPYLIVNKYGFGYLMRWSDRTTYFNQNYDIISILKNCPRVEDYIFKADKKQIYQIFMKYIPKLQINYDDLEHTIDNLNINLISIEDDDDNFGKLQITPKNRVTMKYDSYDGWQMRISNSRTYNYREPKVTFSKKLTNDDKLLLSQIPDDEFEEIKSYLIKIMDKNKKNWKIYDKMTQELEPILFGYDI